MQDYLPLITLPSPYKILFLHDFYFFDTKNLKIKMIIKSFTNNFH